MLTEISKLYVLPHLDYGDIIYHNQRTDMMHLVEQVQYKAALIVSGCWQFTNREKLYKELSWDSLYDRRWNLNIACRTARYSNSFFPFCITNWNSLDESVRLLPSISQFKTTSLSLSDLQGSLLLEYVIELVANDLLKLE